LLSGRVAEIKQFNNNMEVHMNNLTWENTEEFIKKLNTDAEQKGKDIIKLELSFSIHCLSETDRCQSSIKILPSIKIEYKSVDKVLLQVPHLSEMG
jgi:hypothetical protein